MTCCKKEECLLKLKFIDYINNDMIKETKEALLLVNLLTCDNLVETKLKLEALVNELIEQGKILQTFA
jgi:hypothetical protein